MVWSTLLWNRLRRSALPRHQEHLERPTALFGVLLDAPDVGGLLGDAVEQLAPTIDVDNLAPAEDHGHAHLVFVGQKLADVPELRLKIVLLDLGRHADLFELAAPGALLLALLLAVAILSKVHELADDRVGLRGDLDEIQVPTARLLDRFGKGHDAQLLAVLVNDSNFFRPNLLVLANPTIRSGDRRPPLSSVLCSDATRYHILISLSRDLVRSQGDSNPCFRLERPASWAARRWERIVP
jgi:hypothetical protein